MISAEHIKHIEQHYEPTFIQIKDRFDQKITSILTESSVTSQHIEFLTLCVFFKKVNETNCDHLIELSKILTDNNTCSDVKSIIWDESDKELIMFMSCFTTFFALNHTTP
jgi:hypothetical protein